MFQTESHADVFIFSGESSLIINVANNPSVDEIAGYKFISPDNTKLIYNSKNDNIELTVYDISTKAQKIISGVDSSILFQSWAVDPRYFSYINFNSEKKDLYVYDMENNNSVLIDTDIECGGDFSPDDLILMYSKKLANDKIGIVSYNITSERHYEFLNQDFNDYFLAWSSDGEQVAYLKKGTERESINIIRFEEYPENRIIVEITSPVDEQLVHGYLQVYGKATAFDFDKFIFECTKIDLPEKWQTIDVSFGKVLIRDYFPGTALIFYA